MIRETHVGVFGVLLWKSQPFIGAGMKLNHCQQLWVTDRYTKGSRRSCTRTNLVSCGELYARDRIMGKANFTQNKRWCIKGVC